jgi:transcriptional regulator with XRE-family HTH domain
MATAAPLPPTGPSLGERVRHIRQEKGLTLAQVGQAGGLSTSTLSKIENNLLSPTYDTLIALAHGLKIGVEQLFSDQNEREPIGRRAVTRKGMGKHHSTHAYDYEMLCTDISNKRLFPIVAKVKLGSLHELGPLATHDGEEMIYVLTGTIALHTDVYEELVLPPSCGYARIATPSKPQLAVATEATSP